jgi:Zn finger protein HypA/HybF involved in hydrogenase expression
MSPLRLLSFVALCLSSQLALAQPTSADACPTCGYGSQATTVGQGQPVTIMSTVEDLCPSCGSNNNK